MCMSRQPPKDRSTTAFRPTYGVYASPSYWYALPELPMVDMFLLAIDMLLLTTDMDMLLSTTDRSTMGNDTDDNKFADT